MNKHLMDKFSANKKARHQKNIKVGLLMGLLVLLLADSVLLLNMRVKYMPKTHDDLYTILPVGNVSITNGFTTQEIKALQKKYEEYDISYECIQDGNFENMGKSSNIQMVITTDQYASIKELQMVQGSFFMEEDSKTPQLVVDQKAAYELWGTTQCLGERISYQGRSYEITGIVANQEHDEKVSCVYILGNNFEGTLNIERLWVRASQGLNSRDLTIIKQMLTGIGREIEHYQIFSISQYNRQLAAYWQLLLEGIGLIALLSLLGGTILFIKKQCEVLSEVRKQCYVMDYIKEHVLELEIKSVIIAVGISSSLLGMGILVSRILASIYKREQISDLAYTLPVQLQALQSADTIGKMGCILGFILFIGILLLVVDTCNKWYKS